MWLVVSGCKELEIIGDIHDEEEAIDEDDEMKKREDSSTTKYMNFILPFCANKYIKYCSFMAEL